MKDDYIHMNNNEPSGDQLLMYIRGEVPEEMSFQIEQWMQEDIEHEQALLQMAYIFFSQRARERIDLRDSYVAFEKLQGRIRKKKNRLYL